jgi:hypothetical protein
MGKKKKKVKRISLQTRKNLQTCKKSIEIFCLITKQKKQQK